MCLFLSSFSVSGHDLDELVVVQLPVLVDVCLLPELEELLLGQLLPQRRRHRPELLHLDVAVLVPVKDLERLLQVLDRKGGSMQR